LEIGLLWDTVPSFMAAQLKTAVSLVWVLFYWMAVTWDQKQLLLPGLW
jgi:hypothetical protein